MFVQRAFTRTIQIGTIKKRHRPISSAVAYDGDINFRNELRKSVDDINKTMMVACKLRPGSLSTGTTSFSANSSIDPLSCLKYDDLQHILHNPKQHGLPSSQYVENLPPDIHVTTSLKSLFTYGTQCLLNFCDDNNTHETTIFPLIFDFQRFWKHKDKDETSLRSVLKTFNSISGNRITENDMCSILAVHLLSTLVDVRYPKFPYVVSNKNLWKRDLCPCEEKTCRKQVIYGNTLIGSRELFFGRPDVIVFPHKGAVGILLETPSEYQELYDWDKKEIQNVEQEKVLPRSVGQIIKQTITFSYYHRGWVLRNPGVENESVTLIPTIVIRPPGFDVYMYDSKYDVFLKNIKDPFPIWDENYNLNMSSVVLLWMLLNHVAFRPQLNKFGCSLLSHSFGFQIGDVDQDKRALDVTMMNVLPKMPKSDPSNQNSFDVVDFMDCYPEIEK